MRNVVLIAAALGLAACSGTEAAPPEKPDERVTVSTQTTCDELFLDGKPRLWSQAVAAVAAGEAAMDLVVRLDAVAEASGSELKPHVEAMASTVKGDASDAAAFKTAAREVTDICAPYVT